MRALRPGDVVQTERGSAVVFSITHRTNEPTMYTVRYGPGDWKTLREDELNNARSERDRQAGNGSSGGAVVSGSGGV